MVGSVVPGSVNGSVVGGSVVAEIVVEGSVVAEAPVGATARLVVGAALPLSAQAAIMAAMGTEPAPMSDHRTRSRRLIEFPTSAV